MRVLQVNKFFYIKGGSESYLFSLITGLKERGHTVGEFAMKDSRNRPSKWSEFFVEPIDYTITDFREKIRFAGKIIYSFEARRKIAKLLDLFKPDIVHLHIFQHQLSPSILPEIKKRHIPIIYTAHDLKSICPSYLMLTHGRVCEECKGHKYYNCLRYKCVKDSYLKSFINVVEMYFHLFCGYYDLIDVIITPSDFHRRKLVEFRFPEDKVIHIPNFVDETQFSPQFDHDNYFIFLGRLSEEKGILTLLEAMKHVKMSKLLIIGTGPLEEKINLKIKEDKLENVDMVGFQSGNALWKLILNSMFSVMPSECYENGPISLLESFASGKPVIGANIGGIPEHISHGKDGLIFEAKNAQDLADKINYFLQEPNKIITMGKNARAKVENLYSKNLHLDRIEQVYNKLIH